MITRIKAAKKAMIRARCSSSLKEDIARVAMLKELDQSDIVRIACSTFVQQFKDPKVLTGTNA